MHGGTVKSNLLFQSRAADKLPVASWVVTLELSEVVVYGLDVVTQVVQALQHQATFIAGLGLVLWWHLKSWQMVAQLDTTYHVFLCTIDLYNVVSSTLIANPPYFLDFTEVYIVRGN